jgi:carbamoyltransferase
MESLLKKWELVSGCATLLNTSFNLRGEPIVETSSDAIRTFFSSGLDILVLEDYIISKVS